MFQQFCRFNFLFLTCVSLATHAQEQTDDGSGFSSRFSGFAQVTVGRVTDGSPTSGQVSDVPYTLNGKPGVSYNCPCFVSNYEYAGTYQYKKTDIGPETLVGVQGDFKFTPKLSSTIQVVARGADNSIGVDWAYASYKLTPELTLQAGLKRLPLYYYSDFMYIGYDYPWVRPPQDLYAWQIYSYLGANLLYNTNIGRWNVTGNVWLGSRTSNDNKELGNLYYTTQIQEKWKNMIGGYVDATNDIITTRAVFMRTSVERFAVVNGVKSLSMTGENGDYVNDVGQLFYGLTLNVDYNNWIWRSELNYINRPSVKNTYTAQSYSGGYQFGNHTVTLGVSQFQERAAYWPTGTEEHSTTFVTYRWDFAKSQALKIQYDKIKDKSGWLFTGNAGLLSASWQALF